MSLGSQISLHLPLLRRFARTLLGNQRDGDLYVTNALEAIARKRTLPRDVDIRLGLYRVFLEEVGPSVDRRISPSDSGLESIAHRRLSKLSSDSRRALLLTSVEGFSVEDTAYLLDRTRSEVERLVADALAEIQKQTRARVLIIEDEPIIAMDIEMVVRDLGHEVTAVATTRDGAVISAMTDRPDLVLADIQLADDSSGIDAVKDILAEFQVPVIFLTAYPERLLTRERVEPTYLVTKPFQRSTLKTTISQALFFNQATVPDQLPHDVHETTNAPEQTTPPSSELEKIRAEMFDGRAESEVPAESALLDGPAPMQVAVIDGQVRRIAGGPATIRIALETAERARIVQHREILSLLEARVGSNLGAQLERRLQSLEETLARPVDAESGIEIGVKTRNLRRVVASLTEQVTPSTLAEFEAVAEGLDDLAWLFPSWREFIAEARPLNNAEAGALRDVAQQIAAQPDELIAPDVKQVVSELAGDAAAEEIEGQSGIAQTALGRVVTRILAAVGAWVRATISGISENANSSFRKVVGGTLGVAAGLVIVVAPAANLLAQRFPDHFEAIVKLSEQVKKAIP